MVRGLVNSLPASEVSWDVVTGISAGSTLTAALSVFELGQEDAASEFIYSILAQLNQSSIFTQWPGGIVEGLTQHSSIFDSRPLRRLFERVLSGRPLASKRTTCMGASNLRTGLFERFCKHNGVEDVVNAALASAAIPGVFLAQQLVSEVSGRNETYVDGGILVNVDVIGAIEQCLNQGYTQNEIIVDVVEWSVETKHKAYEASMQCAATSLSHSPFLALLRSHCSSGVSISPLSVDTSTMTTIPILLRAYDMLHYGSSERDFAAAQRAYPGVNFRFRIFPSTPIPGSGIDFNQTAMLAMEKLGEADAKAAVSGLAHRKPKLTPIALE